MRSFAVPAATRIRSFADAVFIHVVLLDALEADADASLEQLGVIQRAIRVGGEAVRQIFCHRE